MSWLSIIALNWASIIQAGIYAVQSKAVCTRSSRRCSFQMSVYSLIHLCLWWANQQTVLLAVYNKSQHDEPTHSFPPPTKAGPPPPLPPPPHGALGKPTNPDPQFQPNGKSITKCYAPKIYKFQSQNVMLPYDLQCGLPRNLIQGLLMLFTAGLTGLGDSHSRRSCSEDQGC